MDACFDESSRSRELAHHTRIELLGKRPAKGDPGVDGKQHHGEPKPKITCRSRFPMQEEPDDIREEGELSGQILRLLQNLIVHEEVILSNRNKYDS